MELFSANQNNLSDLKHRLIQVNRDNLPGWSAQSMMSPIGKNDNRQNTPESHSKAGVAIIISHSDKQPIITLIERASHYIGDKHKGQISLPGGKFEHHDQSLLSTAMRETKEEIGLDLFPEHHMLELTSLYIPVSNFLVQPHVFIRESLPTLYPEPSEVKQILSMPLESILPRAAQKTDIKATSGLVLRQVPYYPLQEKVVWGATAMILSELSVIIKELYS